MPSTGLHGEYVLNENSINNNVTRISPGAYALGRIEGNTFYIAYVGRSDSDIKSRLKDHIGNYSYFKYDYFSTAKLAFDKECELYHDFGSSVSLDNKIHPDRPKNSNWECPRCTIFD